MNEVRPLEVDWFDWGRNITSVGGIFMILRYVAIAAKNGITRVWNDCVERDKNLRSLRARKEEHEFILRQDFIRFVEAGGEYARRFHSQGYTG